ncbi:efflux RND transporter permease subunit [Bacteroidales bacterium OttesenSCG-928-A17]|nr:efflux RND transporter permease subunit [Bacteroidales bacterium OttesenSCG-928-A17]
MNFIINRKITICMLFLAITLLGYISCKQLLIELLPNAELPTLYVQVTAPQDMDPSYIESEAVIPLEGAISAIGGVDKIQSNVGSRQATIQVDFKNNINFKITSLQLEQRINELVSSSLPEDFRVQVQKVDATQMSQSFMALQVRGLGGSDRVRNIVDEEVLPKLENIDGVASVSVYGGREKAIEILLDPQAAKALNLTPNRITSLLNQNMQEKVFVGNINEPDKKYFVHVDALYTEVSEIENIVVAPGPVLLKDVATVVFELKEETSYSRVNGRDAISMTLMNESQANLIDLSHKTLKMIDQLNEDLAYMDIEIVVQENSAEIMEENINQIIMLAIEGGLLAIIILWFFLKNIRLVLLIALSIPISVFSAFNIFYAFGLTINSLTLIGIALAIGMLLDNSIVVLENIYRLSGRGATPEHSVVQGTKEVWRSILAATLTTLTVFLPFVFSDNFFIKLIGNNVGISIISTLSISLLVALLFIPMVTYTILKRKNSRSVFYEQVEITQRPVQIYMVLLKTAMRHPGATIFGSILVLVLTLVLSLTLNVQQMQQVSSDRINISMSTWSTNTLDNTDQIVRIMEERLEDLPEKEEVIARVQESNATVTIVLKEDFKKINKRNIGDIKSDVQARMDNISGARISVSEGIGGGSSSDATGLNNFMRLLGIGDNRERVLIKGSDFEMMQLVADDLQYYLSEQDFIRSSRVSSTSRQAEVLLDFDPILLTSYEINRQNISSGLTTALSNQISSGTTFKMGDDTYDIMIRENTPQIEEEEEQQTSDAKTVDDLKAVQIQSSSGGLYELNDLASVNYGRGRARIQRVNQDKQIEVYYSFTQDIESSNELLKTYRSEIDDIIAEYNLPAGVALEIFHEEDEFSDFKFLIFAAFLLIFMILASVFESLTTPLVMLFSVPLAAIGSLLALLITGNSLLNANTLTGFLILIGVVINNGILLIDYSNILRGRGYRRSRALMMAGLSRLRPILITAITTIIALLPLAMGDSEYAGAIGAPFAITVIGGLAFSTLLTLVVIPTVNIGLENTLQWYRTLSIKLKIVHLLLFIAATFFIFMYADGMLWQIVYMIAVVILIPGLTYFAQTSLRKADANVVDSKDDIHIKVRNLVKIYDWPSQFKREWESGLNLRKRLGISTEYHSLKDFTGSIWIFAVFGFLIYFTYFYLESSLWMFLLTFVVYALALNIWRMIRVYLFHKFPASKVVRYLNRFVFWTIPLTLWITLFVKVDSLGLMIVTGVLWLFGIAVYITSRHLYDEDINIERIEGRFSNFKRSYYRLVKRIPVIGKQRKPFKALRGVSFEIRTGMFGLLGPNGAGKSTMMRIICGILDQSYGTIWINGMDTRIYREELQSLIGFLPQEFGTYENMTSWEFLDYQAILKGISDDAVRNERLEYVLKSVHMYERKDDKIGSFSGGMKQRIGIALILLNLPRILIVDEPTAGLDPRERIRFRNLLVELSRERIVIFSTHIIEDISSSCNQVVVINKGDMKYFGDPINMVEMAEGKVWLFPVTKAAFEELDKSMIIHHIQDDDIIQVRYLSHSKPTEDAVLIEPNLEDAYLCLLKNMNK